MKPNDLIYLVCVRDGSGILLRFPKVLSKPKLQSQKIQRTARPTRKRPQLFYFESVKYFKLTS